MRRPYERLRGRQDVLYLAIRPRPRWAIGIERFTAVAWWKGDRLGGMVLRAKRQGKILAMTMVHLFDDAAPQPREESPAFVVRVRGQPYVR